MGPNVLNIYTNFHLISSEDTSIPVYFKHLFSINTHLLKQFFPFEKSYSNPFALRTVVTLWISECTLKCLSIGTPKTINFPFVAKGKLMVFRCPNSQSHYDEVVIYLNFGTPKNNKFSFWNKWKIYYF